MKISLKHSYLCNKKKITSWFEHVKFIFSKIIFTCSRHRVISPMYLSFIVSSPTEKLDMWISFYSWAACPNRNLPLWRNGARAPVSTAICTCLKASLKCFNLSILLAKQHKEWSECIVIIFITQVLGFQLLRVSFPRNYRWHDGKLI